MSGNLYFSSDRNRVKATIVGLTTAFVGMYFEWTNGLMTTYYYAGSQKVAMRDGAGTLYYLFGDHLGNTSVVATPGGALVNRTLYHPWGTVRYQSGTLPTDYMLRLRSAQAYTGQYSYASDFGLMYYGARWYDVSLGRFAQADTVVPGAGNPLAWDRYAGMMNNPVRYTDPSGHFPWLFALGAVVIGGAIIGGNVAHAILISPAVDDPNTPPPTSSDMSGWLINRIQETSSSQTVALLKDAWSGNPVEKAGAMQAWVSLVRGEGAWDFKPDIKVADLEGSITLGGEGTHSQAVANLFYGFIGAEVGFDAELLEAGAGAFHLWENRKNPGAWGGLDTWGDDPFDNWWVGFGIHLQSLFKDDLSKLTPEELARVLKEYTAQNGGPPAGPAGE